MGCERSNYIEEIRGQDPIPSFRLSPQ